MRPQTILFGTIAAVAAIYPFAIFYGLGLYGPAHLAAVLFVVLALRVILLGKHRHLMQLVQLLLVGCLCVLVVAFQSEALLRYYPVLMNLGVASFFWLSLLSGPSLIEQFARAFNKDLSVPQKRYMRGLTKAWAILLSINTLIAGYTACCLSLKLWTLYNGLIAYLVFGMFAAFEFAYRRHYKKRHHG